MRRFILFILASVVICPALSQAQPASRGSDIMAAVAINPGHADRLGKLGAAVQQALAFSDEDTPRSVDLAFDIEGEYANWLVANQSRFFVEIEFQSGQWQVERHFKIPFMLNIYERAYNIAAAVKIYRRGIPRPIMARQIEISRTGAKSYQILRDNPHDGALLLAQKRRLELETVAENELITKIAEAAAEAMASYGG